MSVLVLTESELRACVGFDEAALEAVENAFTWLAEGRVEMPPVMHIEVADNHGDFDIKSAYVRGVDSVAVKVASGFFDNPSRGLPSGAAMVVVLSAETGFCQALLLDNAYLTDLRTGLAGAVAARHLAPETISTVGVVGSGAQARYQIRALCMVRGFDRLLVHGRNQESVMRYIDEMDAALDGVVVEACDLPSLVAQSDLVVTTTQSRDPLIRAEWLHPGLHITAMGSDIPGKQELEAAVLARADLLVCDRRSQCAAMGELQHALDAGLVDATAAVELGEITSGSVEGRRSREQITVCDLTGTGVQDTAIAALALRQAAAKGAGTRIDTGIASN